MSTGIQQLYERLCANAREQYEDGEITEEQLKNKLIDAYNVACERSEYRGMI